VNLDFPVQTKEENVVKLEDVKGHHILPELMTATNDNTKRLAVFI